MQETTHSNALNINRETNNHSTENQFVTFQIGAEEYGIDIMLVQEIIRYKVPTRVFNSNPVVKGVINFRGKVIPVLDMHRKFNLPPGVYDEYTVIIIIEVEKKTLGMIVDRVSDIISFQAGDIQFVDQEFASDIKTEYLRGMGKLKEGIVLLLDPFKIYSFNRLDALQKRTLQQEVVRETNK